MHLYYDSNRLNGRAARRTDSGGGFQYHRASLAGHRRGQRSGGQRLLSSAGKGRRYGRRPGRRSGRLRMCGASGSGEQDRASGGNAGHPGPGLQHPPPAHPHAEDRRSCHRPSGSRGLRVTEEGLICKSPGGGEALISGKTVICAVRQRAN